MNLTCNTFMDLYPLYYDGLASPDTRNAVRQHLAACPDCRAFACRYRSVIARRPKPKAPSRPETLPDFDRGYRTLADRLQRRHIIRTFAVTFILAVCLATALASLFLRREDGDGGRRCK